MAIRDEFVTQGHKGLRRSLSNSDLSYLEPLDSCLIGFHCIIVITCFYSAGTSVWISLLYSSNRSLVFQIYPPPVWQDICSCSLVDKDRNSYFSLSNSSQFILVNWIFHFANTVVSNSCSILSWLNQFWIRLNPNCSRVCSIVMTPPLQLHELHIFTSPSRAVKICNSCNCNT